MEKRCHMARCTTLHILDDSIVVPWFSAVATERRPDGRSRHRPACVCLPTRYQKGVCWEDVSTAGAVMYRVYPSTGCIGCCRVSFGGSKASRRSCQITGMFVARKGDTRPRYPAPFMIRSNMQTGEKLSVSDRSSAVGGFRNVSHGPCRTSPARQEAQG